MRLRSLLYVPAHNEKFVAKAHERGADAIILDLEDGVPADQRAVARAALATAVPAVRQNGAKAFVRINRGDEDDMIAAAAAGADAVLLPKVEFLPQIDFVAERGLKVIAVIESTGSVLDARIIAQQLSVIGVCVGSEDLALDLDATPTPEVLRTPKLLVHYAAKAAGKLSLGLLQSVADYADLDKLRAAAREARLHGFDGATCVHPSAVAVLNEAFSPSDEELDWARRVVAADDGSGVFVVDGRMVDAPVIARARRLLEE